MPDRLSRCFQRCCHLVNDQATTRDAYELAVKQNQKSFILPGPSEALIASCGAGDMQEAVEKWVRFYLGSGTRRPYGTLIPDGSKPSLFDNATRKFLREATTKDLKQWRAA